MRRWMPPLVQYRAALLAALGLVPLAFAIYMLVDRRGDHPLVTLAVAVTFGATGFLFQQTYSQPVLRIDDRVEVRRNTMFPTEGTYLISRAIIHNVGRTAAINCKAYLVVPRGFAEVLRPEPPPSATDVSAWRIAWAAPLEGTVTINVRDAEPVDVCMVGDADAEYPVLVLTSADGRRASTR